MLKFTFIKKCVINLTNFIANSLYLNFSLYLNKINSIYCYLFKIL